MYNRTGEGCSLCGSDGTNKSTCPLNPHAKMVNHQMHPLAALREGEAPHRPRSNAFSSPFMSPKASSPPLISRKKQKPEIIAVAPIRVQTRQSRQERQERQIQELESDRKARACTGKYNKDGGLDTDEIEKLAMTRGISNPEIMGRRELLHHLCPQSTVTAVPPQAFIPYLEFDTSTGEYPLGTELSRGSYGAVYSSGEYAVKIFILDEAIIELDVYARFFHPCINRPVAWSYNSRNKQCYMAMPLGLSITEAYLAGRISIAHIVSDTLSAVGYLNRGGLAHRDIKPANIIYHDGYAKIIDVGLATTATLFSDNKYRTRGTAYTPYYKDPEYVEDIWNSINSETYAIAKTIYDILGHKWSFANMYSFNAEDPVLPGYPEVRNVAELNMLFSESKKPAATRMTTYELLERLPESLIVRQHVGIEIEPPSIPFNNYCLSSGSTWRLTSDNVIALYDLIITKISDINITAQTVFSWLHLVNRSVEVIKSTPNKLWIFGISCLKLSLRTVERGELTEDELRYLYGPGFNPEELEGMVIDIMDHVKCIIASPTSWDYASCSEDLIPMLTDSMKCDYDPTYTRTLLNTGNPKNIDAIDLIDQWLLDNNYGETGVSGQLASNLRSRIPYNEKSIIHPVTEMVAGVSRGGIEHQLIELDELNYTPLIATLISGRNVAKSLELDDALKIYNKLRSKYDEYTSSINHVFSFDIRKYTSRELRDNEQHPFKTTQVTLNALFGRR